MKKVFIVLVVMSVIVLLILIAFINAFSKQGQEQPPSSSSVVVPTSTPLSSVDIQREIDRLTNDTSKLSADDQSKLKSIQLSLPVENEDIAIAYSPITEQFIVQKKSDKADEVLDLFLENNGLKDLFTTHPEYFAISTGDLNSEIVRLEDRVIDLYIADDADDSVDGSLQPQANSDQSKQLSIFKDLISIMFAKPDLDISIPVDESGSETEVDANSIIPTISEEPQIKSSSNLDAAVKASCYKFRMNKCGGSVTETTSEVRPGVTNNTYPVDTALINELFSNPNAVGLRNRRWQFEAGMIHPKLVRFLNEFVKTNTIEKHLGLANGAGRCCARNGNSKAPATGCKLTPHRLGVAIDLGVINGANIRKNNANDANYRRALDWINSTRGSLRPDSVTFSDAFAGMYPSDLFHIDSGHRDHLHIDFRRSLTCQ